MKRFIVVKAFDGKLRYLFKFQQIFDFESRALDRRIRSNFSYLSLFAIYAKRAPYDIVATNNNLPCRFQNSSHHIRTDGAWDHNGDTLYRLTDVCAHNHCIRRGSCDFYSMTSFFSVLKSVKHAAKGQCSIEK